VRLARAAEPPDGTVARTVLAALGGAGTPAAQQALCALARDAGATVALRVGALKALVRPAHPTGATVAALLALADDRRDPEIGRHALFVAGAVGHASAIDGPEVPARVEAALLERFGRCSGTACADLLIAMGNLATPGILPALEQALRRPDESVRVQAARALRQIPDPAADRMLVAALARDEPAVRSAALFAARSRPFGPLVDAVAHAAEVDPAASVRRDAVGVLADHVPGWPRAAEALAAAANDADPAVRRLARAVLRPEPSARE
jgi:HEAT repeat protein